MVTTFFGSRSFGGDAAYVDRLSRALLRAGHRVEVIHCGDAFEAVRGAHPPRPYEAPEGLRIHTLASRFGFLSPLATQQTGRPWFKTSRLKALLDRPDWDVIHFHNISLVGGPGVLELGRPEAVKLMTAHEHWLICPMHLLWKEDRKPCDSPQCGRCMIRGRRPPQLWRFGSSMARGLSHLDALLFPSQYALDEHVRRGVTGNLVKLPYFLPEDWAGTRGAITPPGRSGAADSPAKARPILAAAGRLVKMKGFQTLIPLMDHLPEADLVIAGTGPYETTLRRLAQPLPNVIFAGLLSGSGLADLFARARAVVVPSLFPETFGYVVAEAFSMATPVVAHRGGGAIVETAVETGGGLGYDTPDQLLTALRRMIHDDRLRERLARNALETCRTVWSESAHLERYYQLIESLRRRKREGRASGPAVRFDAAAVAFAPPHVATTPAGQPLVTLGPPPHSRSSVVRES
jgi:glycosyltransferase involved in cell wall biosynthesis